MQTRRLSIPDVILIEPVRHGDARGFFSEVWRADTLASLGIEATFVQDNHAYSAERGVLRGLHYQAPPSAQGKLVRCPRGRVLDVAVDIRAGSPTFGRHVTAELSADNWRQLWVPPGFAHGYLTLEPDCEVLYKVTSAYDPIREGGIAWDDPYLAIDWGMPVEALVLAARDRAHPRLVDATAVFHYGA